MPKSYTTQLSGNMLVQFGNLIFHIRNYLFPIFYLALFIPSKPIFSDIDTALIIGLVLIITGISVRGITIGLVYIVRGGKNRQIYAENLVTEGIYKICRNPMYLGNILLLLGFGVFANSFLFMVLFFPLFVFFYFSIIKAEEAFLFSKFGEEFEKYRRSTNALIPDLSRLKSAFKGYRFDFKRVIRKEYNSLFIYFSGIILLLFYKNQVSFLIFLISFLVLAASYLSVKYWKYHLRGK